MMQDIEKEENCEYCQVGKNNWDFLTSVYVICLEDRPDRLQTALQEIHASGLCQANTHVFLAKRSKNGFIAGCWDSHNQVAKYACERKEEKTLVLEDDFLLDKDRPLLEIIEQIKLAISELPKDKWTRLSLGHISWFKMPYSPNLDRAASVLTHAQIWHYRGLEWMATHPYDKASKLFNIQVDGFISLRLSHSYSIKPMVAFQRNEGSDRAKFADIMQPDGLKATEVWIPSLYAFGLILALCLAVCFVKFVLGCGWSMSIFPIALVFVVPFAVVWLLILQDVF